MIQNEVERRMDIKPIIAALAALALTAAPSAAPSAGQTIGQTATPAPAGLDQKSERAEVDVKAPNGRSAVVVQADLRAMRRYSVPVAWGGGHVYAGAAVSEILAEVGAPSEARLHGPALDEVVIVKGRDGFIAVLAIAETAMSLKGQPVILADEEDGKPLDGKQGALRLVIGGEAKPPRSVRDVVEIELRPIR
jgi:hypothetical protein